MTKFSLILILVSSYVYSSSFYPISPAHLIKSADVIIKGQFIEKKYHQIEDEKIVTEFKFEIDSEFGLNAKNLGIHEVSIYYPGGIIGDHVQLVEGTPEFLAGQKIILHAQNMDDGRLWGLSLGLGVFSIIKVGQREMLVNHIFRKDPVMSSWDWEYFQENVHKIKQSKLHAVYLDKYRQENNQSEPFKSEKKGKFRSIASVDKLRENENDGEDPFHHIGLVLALGVLGGISAFIARGQRKS